MAEAHQFSPEELDHLEDALEDLEASEASLFEDESDAVRERLSAYRAILVASREALPLEDVPPGVLDGVLEKARAGAGDSVVAATPDVANESTGLWARLRRTLLLPALAVAGSAALILIIVRPDVDRVPVVADAQRPSKGDASPPPPPSPARPRQAELDAEPEPVAEPEPNTVSSSLADETEPESEDRKAAAAEVREQAVDDEDEPSDAGLELGQRQKAEVQSKLDRSDSSPRWDLIAKGDRARQDGDCSSARRHYEAALSDSDERVLARAHAGLGLCEARLGRYGAAEEMYERARDLDPEITDFLDQSGEPEVTAPKKARPKRRARKKSKRQASPDEAVDAFE